MKRVYLNFKEMKLFTTTILYLCTFLSDRVSVSGIRFKRGDINIYGDRSTILVFPNVTEDGPRIGELIRNGNVNIKDSSGRTPLFLASERGEFNLVKALIEHGADVNSKNNEKWTALHISTKNGHSTIARLLIENGANVDATTNLDRTPLFEAAIAGHVAVAKVLIENRANVNAQDKDGSTALHSLSWNENTNGKADIAKLLLENGASVNIRGYINRVPLHEASLAGQIEVAKVLHSYGAIVDVANKENFTPLLDACTNGRFEMAKLLIQFGADVNFKNNDKESALHLAARSGKPEIVRLLIENGTDINAENNLKRTPIFEAAAYGHIAVINLLIDNKANVNAQDKDESTPLHSVSWTEDNNGKAEIAKLLLENGALVNVMGYINRVPLHEAAIAGQIEVAKILHSYGAIVDSEDKNKCTPLLNACATGRFEMVKLLLEYGADVNSRNSDKEVPLFWAVKSENEELVELLFQHDAKRNAKNKEGVSPYDIAKQIGNAKFNRFFEKAMLQNIQSACQSYSTDYIHNGEFAQDGEFPWMAALGYVSESDYRVTFDCGGTIISNFFILSAAHCVKLRQPSIARIGKISLIDVDDEDEIRTVNRHIKEIIYHPEHHGLTKRNDIALLRLKRAIPFSDNIKPACLQTDTRDEPPNVPLIVTGWGITSFQTQKKSNELRKAQLMTMPLAQCNTTLMNWGKPRSDPALRDGLIDGQYCAYDPQGRNDSCKGDSGGPLQYFPTNESTVATVLGIVSFGAGCGSRLPSVYTRVAYYLNWIEPIVWSEL